MNDEPYLLKFTKPLDQVFLDVMDKNSPLPKEEQQVLAVCLWEWMRQNAPNEKGAIVRAAIEERWPELNWGAEPAA